jgi:hypothetical protein
LLAADIFARTAGSARARFLAADIFARVSGLRM